MEGTKRSGRKEEEESEMISMVVMFWGGRSEEKKAVEQFFFLLHFSDRSIHREEEMGGECAHNQNHDVIS